MLSTVTQWVVQKRAPGPPGGKEQQRMQLRSKIYPELLRPGLLQRHVPVCEPESAFSSSI